MLAYNITKSKIGHFGFSTLNIYTNDEIYCSGFTPNQRQARQISQLIEELNFLFFSETPSSLYITKKDKMYYADLKVLGEFDPIFASSKARSLKQVINKLKKEILVNTDFSQPLPHKLEQRIDALVQ